MRPVLEALEEQVVLLRLLGEASRAPSEVTVRIGHERPVEGLAATSVVTVGYGESGGAGSAWSAPPAWTTPATIGAVRAVARYVGRVLEESP